MKNRVEDYRVRVTKHVKKKMFTVQIWWIDEYGSKQTAKEIKPFSDWDWLTGYVCGVMGIFPEEDD